MPTVILGCARDIVEHCGVPRFVFSDLPLGNSCGRPGDEESHDFTLSLGLDLLESARWPRTTVQSPLQWHSDRSWKEDFLNVDRLSEEELTKKRADFDSQKEVFKDKTRKLEASAGETANDVS